MVLDVAQVEADLAAGGDAVRFVAALGEAFDDVGFSAEEAHEGIVLFAAGTDLLEEVKGVFAAGDEDGVFDCVGFVFDGVDGGREGVDYVIAVWEVSISDGGRG